MKQKEGDTMMFLYLLPTGMNDPNQPTWGSWAGRHGPSEEHPRKSYYWANQTDTWRGTTNRDNTLLRWAAHLQNDFAARMDWCVLDRAEANHPPQLKLAGELSRSVRSGERVSLDASGSADPDGDKLHFEWIVYPEASNYSGPVPVVEGRDSRRASLVAPALEKPASLHVVLAATDSSSPPLTRYARVVLQIEP